MIRALIIDDDARAAAAAVLKFAEQNHCVTGPGATAPGDIPGHVAQFGDYRVVFSLTRHKGALFRHLSISVPAKGKYPNPVAAFTIAQLFGFTGWDGKTIDRTPEDWMGSVCKEHNCVSLAQELR